MVLPSPEVELQGMELQGMEVPCQLLLLVHTQLPPPGPGLLGRRMPDLEAEPVS
jgi:hypothetical protein